MKLSDVIAMQDNLEAANMSQYGDTGWSYGKRALAPAAGYLPTRSLAGFPATPKGGGRGMGMPRPSGSGMPRTPLGTGTATGMKVSPPKMATMVHPTAPKTFHPTMPKSPHPTMPKAPTVSRPHLGSTAPGARKTLSSEGTSEGAAKGWESRGHFAKIDPYDTSVMREPQSKAMQPKSEFTQMVRNPRGSGIQRQWDEQDRLSKSRGWIESTGTSEGAEKGWDSRGRGRKQMQTLPDGSVVGIRRGNRESRSLREQRIANTPDSGAVRKFGKFDVHDVGLQDNNVRQWVVREVKQEPTKEDVQKFLGAQTMKHPTKAQLEGLHQSALMAWDWKKNQTELNAMEGEPIGGAYSVAHIDPVVWFHPPSLTKRLPNEETRIPTDDPGEKNNRFLDVDKRHSKDTEKFRMDLLKKKGPGGAPPMIPVRTTLVSPHSAVYTPGMQSAAEYRMNRRVPKRGYTKYSRRGCI